jgi:predicted secreted protein
MYSGRLIKVKIGTATIGNIISKTVTHAREAVDVTTDDQNGWRRVLPEPGARSLDIAFEGVASDVDLTVWIDIYKANVNVTTMTLEYGDGTVASAAEGFFLSSFEVTGAQDGHVAMKGTLLSSGLVTFTEV